MASDGCNELTFYPAYCHRASPTYFAWVRLSCANVHSLATRKGFEGQNLYFYLNHPVQFVCLVGVVVAFDGTNAKKWIMTLDDSSGATLEMVRPRPQVQAQGENAATSNMHEEQTKHKEAEEVPLDMTLLGIGKVIKAKGTIDTFWGSRQLRLERFDILTDTMAEVKSWEQRTRYFDVTLSKPWVVSQAEQEMLLREAEGVREGDKGRTERRQARQRRLQEREKEDAEKIMRQWQREEKLRAREAQACKEESAKAIKQRS